VIEVWSDILTKNTPPAIVYISSCSYTIETSIFLERQCTLGMVITPVISNINSPQPIRK